MPTRAHSQQATGSSIDCADAELIRRCLAGDTQAWADLYLRYRTPLYGLCLRWTHDHALVEDVIHDTFVRAFEQLNTFDASRRFFPWLAAIAKNRLHDIRRQRRNHATIDLRDPPLSLASDSTAEAVIDAEARDRLLNSIAALPNSQRTALLMTTVEGLSYAQVARILGASESAVKSLIFRARSMLRQSLRVLTPVFSVRLWRQRTNQAGRRMSAIASRLSIDPGLIDSLGISLLIATVAVIGPSTTSESVRGPRPSRIVVVASDTQPPRTAVQHEPRAVFAAAAPARGDKAPGIRPAIDTGPTRPKTVAPSKTNIGFQVVGPDGEVVYGNETTLKCDGQGADLIPQNLPLRATC